MTKENQKILYDHYKAIADNKKKKNGVDYKPIIRENCAKYAADILKSFPDFEKKEKNLEQMNKTELIEICIEKGLDYTEANTKAELILIIKGQE